MNKKIIAPIILLLFLTSPALALYKFCTVTPGQDDCVLAYVRSQAKAGILYKLEHNEQHIEPVDSPLTSSLAPLSIGIADGCTMRTNNLYQDYHNTLYCNIAKLILNK